MNMPRKINRNETILNLIARLQNDVDTVAADVVRLREERDAAVELAKKEKLANEQLEKMVKCLQEPPPQTADETPRVGELLANESIRETLAEWLRNAPVQRAENAYGALETMCRAAGLLVSPPGATTKPEPWFRPSLESWAALSPEKQDYEATSVLTEMCRWLGIAVRTAAATEAQTASE